MSGSLAKLARFQIGRDAYEIGEWIANDECIVGYLLFEAAVELDRIDRKETILALDVVAKGERNDIHLSPKVGMLVPGAFAHGLITIQFQVL